MTIQLCGVKLCSEIQSSELNRSLAKLIHTVYRVQIMWNRFFSQDYFLIFVVVCLCVCLFVVVVVVVVFSCFFCVFFLFVCCFFFLGGRDCF